jgi:hypothetical protein
MCCQDFFTRRCLESVLTDRKLPLNAGFNILLKCQEETPDTTWNNLFRFFCRTSKLEMYSSDAQPCVPTLSTNGIYFRSTDNFLNNSTSCSPRWSGS